MKKVILTKGLPASGKSTWAKKYQADNPNTVRVNKDELRAMLHDSVWSKGREEFVLKVRNFIVETALKNGHDVIVDDTNLHSKHKNEMWRIASANDATVEEQSFLDVSVEECIKRDLKRFNSVGEQVIRRMYRQFLQDKNAYTPKEGLPNAVLCDIDGTLALFDGNPYERDFSQDKINEPVKRVLDCESLTTKIILVSGRKNKFLKQTEEWLEKNDVRYDEIFMPRADDDNRKDTIIKTEIFDREIRDKYNILYVLDDRDQVVELWRSMNITCFQVAYGNF